MSEAEIREWWLSRLPPAWFAGPPNIQTDSEEVLVVGRLDELGLPGAARAQRFREETREQRMRLAQEAERRFGRKVSWGVLVGDQRRLFTTHSTPVMTRLRLPERQVLDTLVEAGVARSRSDALAWCVRLVGRHQADWISELREALVKVAELRHRGPR